MQQTASASCRSRSIGHDRPLPTTDPEMMQRGAPLPPSPATSAPGDRPTGPRGRCPSGRSCGGVIDNYEYRRTEAAGHELLHVLPMSGTPLATMPLYLPNN